jgi:small-conductance mechanosensitive channel
MNLNNFKTLLNYQDLYTFGIIAITLILLYFSIGKIIKTSRMANDQKRRTLSNIRNFFLFVLVTSIFILWATELYQFVISIAALMAGFAIAGKEVFLCFGGSFYKTFARPFSVGDRIEVGGIRGDVVDVGLMSTQLLEVGPKDYTQQLTGRMITIPNSQFLTSKVFNETDAVNEGRDFVLHVFQVPIKNDSNWAGHKEILLECAKDSCDKYIDQANNFFKNLAKKRQVDAPYIEPRINVKFDSHDQILLIVRVSVPVERRGTVEQDIINNYLAKSH